MKCKEECPGESEQVPRWRDIIREVGLRNCSYIMFYTVMAFTCSCSIIGVHAPATVFMHIGHLQSWASFFSALFWALCVFETLYNLYNSFEVKFDYNVQKKGLYSEMKRDKEAAHTFADELAMHKHDFYYNETHQHMKDRRNNLTVNERNQLNAEMGAKAMNGGPPGVFIDEHKENYYTVLDNMMNPETNENFVYEYVHFTSINAIYEFAFIFQLLSIAIYFIILTPRDRSIFFGTAPDAEVAAFDLVIWLTYLNMIILAVHLQTSNRRFRLCHSVFSVFLLLLFTTLHVIVRKISHNIIYEQLAVKTDSSPKELMMGYLILSGGVIHMALALATKYRKASTKLKVQQYITKTVGNMDDMYINNNIYEPGRVPNYK